MDDEPDRNVDVSAGSLSSKGPGSQVTRRKNWQTSGRTRESRRQTKSQRHVSDSLNSASLGLEMLELEAYRSSIVCEVTGVKPSALNWMV